MAELADPQPLEQLARAVINDPSKALDMARAIVFDIDMAKTDTAYEDELREISRTARHRSICPICEGHILPDSIPPDAITRFEGDTVHLDCALDVLDRREKGVAAT